MGSKKQIVQPKLPLELPISAELLTVPEVAGVLRVSKWTLLDWRKEGKGPPWVRVARLTIRYPRRGLIGFLREHLHGGAGAGRAIRIREKELQAWERQ